MAKNWYIVHTHTGFENKVKATLEDRIKTAGQQEYFGEILVPTEQVVEMVKGARKTSERKFFPGYILIHMEMNEFTWHTVQETPRVTGFVGINMSQAGLDKEIYKKIPSLTEKEAMKIIGRIEEGANKPKPKVIFAEGDVVRVIDGPFANFQGVVEEVYPDKGRVKVMVSIFGRSTPVELEYIQVSTN
ncbi:transcription termination/antitermination protein NusG [Desulfobulbus alkaliphilus]|uniref:transcription termination/antitermination protein NusG n=1 Tax=Desulfobulbus alkaliphilus TaxID=869814 RepID=UPI0019649952|nr:transcription termination/antitermination protein NusG [Desulfobulbus alkaliphilus]MBM9535921.1 transcription termination/antitermination protein NusG [Desulfobulbus alkaliphilus]